MRKKSAFTLAEVLITLMVIGIITAVIIPVAIHSKPDENIMKFKKAHNTLYQVISELVNSDKYYLNGDLGVKPDGSLIDKKSDENIKYFCNSFADIITPKSKKCSNADSGYYFSHMHLNTNATQTSNPEYGGTDEHIDSKFLDKWCKTKTNAGEEIVTTDGIIFYQVNPAYTFGGNFKELNIRLFGAPINTYDLTGFDQIYKPFCIDIDGINKGEDPFGYGIRADGKILTGKRADEWLSKSIQGEN